MILKEPTCQTFSDTFIACFVCNFGSKTDAIECSIKNPEQQQRRRRRQQRQQRDIIEIHTLVATKQYHNR